MEEFMDFTERYQNEIVAFFFGVNHFERTQEKGHTWIAEHDSFDTLTIEPPEGGQYEIAVRIPVTPQTDFGFGAKFKFRGYIAGNGHFRGVNTDGH